MVSVFCEGSIEHSKGCGEMSNRKENEMDIKITLKDAYEELWRCRDFELEHLWQRSIFLATLLVVVYPGYGSLIACSLDKGLCGKLLVNWLWNNDAA